MDKKENPPKEVKTFIATIIVGHSCKSSGHWQGGGQNLRRLPPQLLVLSMMLLPSARLGVKAAIASRRGYWC